MGLNKGISSVSNDHFGREDWGEFQDKNLFALTKLYVQFIKFKSFWILILAALLSI